MRPLPIASLLLLVSLTVQAQSTTDKQKKLEATKLENCPRLKTYFERRAASCPKTAARAQAVRCATVEDHDELNGMLRACAEEIDVNGPPPPPPEDPPAEVPACRAVDAEGTVLADVVGVQGADC